MNRVKSLALIVAGLVLPHLVKLHSSSLEGADVLARKYVVNQLAGAYFNPSYLF